MCYNISTMIPINILRLDDTLPLPTYAREGDAGMDLLATETVTIPPRGGRVTMGTGIAVEIPIGYGGFVYARSGLADRYGITITNGVGVIDAGYRGEVHVILTNTDLENPYTINRGDRVAQLVISKVETVQFEVVESLSNSHRGVGGLGHSGK